ALLKVARLTPCALPTAEPISTLVGGGDIASRVRSLVDDAADASAAARVPRRDRRESVAWRAVGRRGDDDRRNRGGIRAAAARRASRNRSARLHPALTKPQHEG